MNHAKVSNCAPTITECAKAAQNASLFLFDMGNVVIKNIHVLPQIIEKYGLPKDEFAADYAKYDFPMMDGTISTAAYWDHIAEKFGVRVQGDPFEEFFKPFFNEPMTHIIRKLREKGKRVVAASNTFKPHYDPLVRDGFTNVFDVFYASHLMKVSKPSRLFFEYILKREGFTPDQCFFTDDYKENIDAAHEMGIASLWYADEAHTAADEKLKKTFSFLE